MSSPRVRHRFGQLLALADGPLTVPLLVALLIPTFIWLAIRVEESYQAEEARQFQEQVRAEMSQAREEWRAEQKKALQFIRETDALRAKDRARQEQARQLGVPLHKLDEALVARAATLKARQEARQQQIWAEEAHRRMPPECPAGVRR